MAKVSALPWGISRITLASLATAPEQSFICRLIACQYSSTSVIVMTLRDKGGVQKLFLLKPGLVFHFNNLWEAFCCSKHLTSNTIKQVEAI